MTYEVCGSFLGVRDEPPKPFAFITITPGSVIEVIGEVQQSGLVDVLYDGQIVAAFMRDIQARAEMVESVGNS
jgi:hypothetical protein